MGDSAPVDAPPPVTAPPDALPETQPTLPMPAQELSLKSRTSAPVDVPPPETAPPDALPETQQTLPTLAHLPLKDSAPAHQLPLPQDAPQEMLLTQLTHAEMEDKG